MSIKILTVDDSKTIRLIVTKAFKPFDCKVLEADNGVSGLAVAAREKPDLILLDYTMPLMDGSEVLTRLRADPTLKATPVIMLTAEAGRDTVMKIAQRGVRDYLIKPFQGELLVERVGRVVDLKLASTVEKKRKRIDDPISVFVVDDKPPIHAQVRSGLSDLPWNVTSAEDIKQAMEFCLGNEVDVVLASLALPAEGAFTLFENLRGNAKTASIPVLGMCVRTATTEQERAQQTGFASVINKPIEPADLKSKVCRILALETWHRYFKQQDGSLTLLLPKEFNRDVAQDVSSHLPGQLVNTVEAGGDKLIIDLLSVETATLPLVELIISTMKEADKLALRCAVVGSDAIKSQCLNYEESQAWLFAGTFEQALTLFA
jgi:two-component system cell cycle response regulator